MASRKATKLRNNFAPQIIANHRIVRNMQALLTSRIAVVILGCLVLSCTSFANDDGRPNTWTLKSGKQLYDVTITPRDGVVKIGSFQDWLVTVTAKQSLPVFPANILVGGGMNGHGHGLPSQPIVSEHLGQGTYLVEGVRFNMAGDWTLSFLISSDQGSDKVDFKLKIDF